MKWLVLGGAQQGKLAYAAGIGAFSPSDVGDGGAQPLQALEAPVIHRLHLLVRQLLEQGKDPAAVVLERLRDRDGWTVICDEVGYGVVPVDAFTRRWRDEVGNLCIALAAEADRVDRVVAGLPQRIKG